MPSSNDCWGIEIGSHAIKAVRLQRSGPVVGVTDFEYIPHKKVLSTPDINVDESIQLALDQLTSKHNVSKSSVVISIPGNKAFARFATLPPVDPKKIPDIVKFEAVQQIPFPIDEVEWDYQVFSHEDSPDVEVGIFAITKERIYSWLSNLDAVNMPVHGVAISPVSIYNALAYDLNLHDSPRGTVLLDIGTTATDVIVCESGRVWLRTIPLGGHQFTEALVRSFKLSYTKAEQLKKEAATSKYAKQIFQAMRPVFVDLVQEVQRSLGYYQSLHRDAELLDLIGMGSTFSLPGLQKFLKQQLNMNVMRLEKFEKIKVEGRNAAAFGEHLITMAPAYGLALQGMELEQVSCNLLPANLIRTQIWKSKKPWMSAAAAVMVLSAGIGFAKLKMDQSAFASKAEVREEIDSIVSNAKKWQSEIKKVQGDDPRMKIENIRRIMDYRSVWPSLLTDINDALMATKPQDAILDGDRKEIAKLNRPRRNQIDIEKLTVVYQYNNKSGEELRSESIRQGTSADSIDIWGPRTNPAAASDSKSKSKRSSSDSDENTNQNAPKGKPSYVITFKGTTPVNVGVEQFLSRFTKHFDKIENDMQKIEESGKVRPRPYKIVSASLRSVGNVISDDNNNAVKNLFGNANNPLLNPNAGNRNEKTDPRVTAAKKLLPQDPLKAEGTQTDKSFEIQLTVELVRPEDARQAEIDNSTAMK